MTARTGEGVAVTVSPAPVTGLCAVALAVPAGRRDDPPGRAGLAHVVEHLAANREPIAAPVITNALTTWDVTIFETLGHRDEVDRAVSWLLGMLRPLNVTAAGLGTELAVIDVEAGGHGGPHDRLQSVIGPRAERSAILPSDIEEFHAAHYRADQVALSLAGDLGPDAPSATGSPLTPSPSGPVRSGDRLQVLSVQEGPAGAVLSLRVPGLLADEYPLAVNLFANLAGPARHLLVPDPPSAVQVDLRLKDRPWRILGQFLPGRRHSRITLSLSPLMSPPDGPVVTGRSPVLASLIRTNTPAVVEATRAAVLDQWAKTAQDPVLLARAQAAWALLRPGGLDEVCRALAAVPTEAVLAVLEQLSTLVGDEPPAAAEPVSEPEREHHLVRSETTRV